MKIVLPFPFYQSSSVLYGKDKLNVNLCISVCHLIGNSSSYQEIGGFPTIRMQVFSDDIPVFFSKVYRRLLNYSVISHHHFPGMKKPLSAFLCLLLILAACRKNSTQSSDALGSWKLIEVYDKNTNTRMLPPASANIDVVLTFLSNKTFAGHTLRNSLSDGAYRQNGSEITFKGFSMTKIAEDQWGGSFLSVLTACSLQSTSPCSPSIISLQGNFMTIRTSIRYDVTLKKI